MYYYILHMYKLVLFAISLYLAKWFSSASMQLLIFDHPSHSLHKCNYCLASPHPTQIQLPLTPTHHLHKNNYCPFSFLPYTNNITIMSSILYINTTALSLLMNIFMNTPEEYNFDGSWHGMNWWSHFLT